MGLCLGIPREPVKLPLRGSRAGQETNRGATTTRAVMGSGQRPEMERYGLLLIPIPFLHAFLGVPILCKRPF